MQLSDLPQFSVDATKLVGGVWVLEGVFNHLRSVAENRSWLYAPRAALIGDIEALDRQTRRARFNTMDPNPPRIPTMGQTFPWLSGYWQAFHIDIILDPNHLWRPLVFRAEDALERPIPEWRVQRRAIGAIPRPDETVVPGAWNHEHCMICNSHIDPDDLGYLDDDEHWLCTKCHDSYAVPHDLDLCTV